MSTYWPLIIIYVVLFLSKELLNDFLNDCLISIFSGIDGAYKIQIGLNAL